MSTEPVVPVPTSAELQQCMETLLKLRKLAEFHRDDGSTGVGPCERDDLVALYAAELVVGEWQDALT